MAPSALSHGDGAPGAGASHCPMGTVPRVLVRRTASPAHTDFGGLNSGAAPVVVRLDVVPLPPRSSAQTVAGCRLGGYPVGRDRWGGDRCGRDVPRINIGADVWGESSIMTGVFQCWFSSTLHVGWGLCDRVCLVVVCRGGYCLGGGVLLFMLGSSLGGVGQVRGLLGGERRGWCEE
jgi:hypothetical protein